LRVEYPGAVYHVMNRGDRREPIFKVKDDADRKRFVETLREACAKTSCRVHAYPWSATETPSPLMPRRRPSRSACPPRS